MLKWLKVKLGQNQVTVFLLGVLKNYLFDTVFDILFLVILTSNFIFVSKIQAGDWSAIALTSADILSYSVYCQMCIFFPEKSRNLRMCQDCSHCGEYRPLPR